ncbi:MAG: molybdopterin/thiamine biosynthesis adenylyltransferase [Crocinitomix sp.]|jgi:molybdopterin/thiamine biosynthesis adenylyltransferase
MYLLKKYLTVREGEGHIIIAGGDQTVYVPLTKQNYELLEKISSKGIDLSLYESSDIVQKLIASNCLIEQRLVKSNYSRKELFFSYLGVDLDKERVENYKILVLGAGGGGSTLVYAYAQFGFKYLWSLDFDIVEKSELEKTMIYRKGDIGKKKVRALKETIQDSFDTTIKVYDEKVQNYARLTEIIKEIQPDFIVNAIDPDPRHKLMLNDICIQTKTPVLFIAYSYESLILGPLIEPGQTSCYRSYYNYIKEGTQGVVDFETIKRVTTINSIQPSVSFNTNILASLALKETLFFMHGKTDYVSTYNSLIFYNVLTMEGESYELSCSSCQCKKVRSE